MKSSFSRVGVLVGCAFALLATTRSLAEDAFVVVHSRDVQLSSVSAESLRKIFTGRTKQWGNGTAVQVAIIAGEAPETAFLAHLLGIDRVADLLSSIQQQVFRGEMRRPMVIRSSEQCIQAARSTPGVVCIARAGMTLPAEVVAEPIH